jgi:hypothetical protein
VAGFFKNSIDAHARHVTIIRGRSRGQSHLMVVDDGDGVPLEADGKPNFKYRICIRAARLAFVEPYEISEGVRKFESANAAVFSDWSPQRKQGACYPPLLARIMQVLPAMLLRAVHGSFCGIRPAV